MTSEIQLTLFDYKEMPLAELELVVQHGLSTFMSTGLALLAIREGKKYREAGYSDFGVYLEERWGMAESRGWQLMNAGNMASEISSTIVEEIRPTHESQLRPLARLGTLKDPQPERWATAWKEACDLAGEGQQPTAKQVEDVVKEMLWVEPPPIPTGDFRVIYADPPWQFDNSGFDQSAAAHYPTMPTDKIMQLQIPSADNSVCFMWATNAMLTDAFEVLQAWGFEYKSNFVWVKETGPTIGFYTTSRHELLLIGTKGSRMLPEVRPISIIRGDVTEHSRKPENVYAMIESMYDGPYLELFARVRHEGWTIWGNENV
jgi:N6-adenosine-specific RNA methylase IME4